MLALRLARFEHLVDVNRVASLAGVTLEDGRLRIGATTRHRAVERQPAVVEDVPLLARATARVGHFQIRNRGTIGGALAHADAAAEQPAVAVALGATMEAASIRGTRTIPAEAFFEGTWTTSLAADEVLTAAHFPIWEGRTGFAVEEVARRSGDFALVGVACGVAVDDAGGVSRAAVAVFGVGATPVRAPAAEAALLAGAVLADVGAAASAEVEPHGDLHASASYRKRVTGVLVRRALTRAIEEAHGA